MASFIKKSMRLKLATLLGIRVIGKLLLTLIQRVLILKCSKINATSRPITFYEWCGMAKYTTGKEDRLFITADFWSNVPSGSTLQEFVDIRTKTNAMMQRNMKDYIPDGSCQTMVITPTQHRLDFKNVTALLFTYYFKRETFIRQVGQYTSVSLKESCSDAVRAILPSPM